MLAIYFAISFFLILLLVPIVRLLAIRLGVVDTPDGGRKIHKKVMPYMGGVAVYFSMFFTYWYYVDFNLSRANTYLWILGFIVVVFGTLDDRFDIKAIYKLAFQIIVAVCAALIITDIEVVGFFGRDYYLAHWQAIILTVIWIVALMNAFNLIDGLDGLTSGIGIISLIVIAVSAYQLGDQSTLVFAYIMIGSLLGFLFYNFYPATIFLGDSGALLIGFFIGIYTLNEYKTATLTTTSIIFLISFIPILDATLSFVRRKLNGQSAFKADALHFHHRLIRKEFSHQATVLIIYLIMSFYASVALIISFSEMLRTKYIVGVVAVIVTWLIIEYLYLLSDKYTIIRKMVNKIRRKYETKNNKRI